MTAEFNLRPPINAPMVDSKGILTEQWEFFFRQLFLFYQNDFTPNFIKVPSLTSTEIASVGTSQNGILMYNSTTNEFVGVKNNTLVTFTTT